jgi:CDP-glycerol glycerophosphotransferase (TagB/SpsB family)
LGDPLTLGDGLTLEFMGDGTVSLVHDPHVLVVSSIDLSDGPRPALRVSGTLSDPRTIVRSVRLSGQRVATRNAEWEATPLGQFHATIPLNHEAWDGQTRPLPSGRFVLEILAESDHPIDLAIGASRWAGFGRRAYGQSYDWQLSGKDRCLELELSAPLAPDEIGRHSQKQLRSASRRATSELEGTFFSSWYGRQVSDSPLAIFRELSARGIGEPYTWEVADPSVAIPEGAVAAVVGSRQWWRASTTARHVVTNVWQRSDFLKRDGQVVVQTWHGTPYKLLGLDRPTKAGRPGSIRKIQRDTRQWDVLISQNPHSSEVFRRAYLWDRPILETGYPRNDALAHADPIERSVVRQRLGLREDQIAVLYAPTWRENDRSMVGVLNLPRIAAALGPDYRILMRGHSITVRAAPPVHTDTVLDVTTYPDPTELMLAADVLVTDYSSIMFDFSVTGRPMLFYVPDLDEYAGTARPRWRAGKDGPGTTGFRGVYFDLASMAPGPLLTKERSLIAELLGLRQGHRTHDAAYRAWQATFNPHDDGAASTRVVDQVFCDLGDSFS